MKNCKYSIQGVYSCNVLKENFENNCENCIFNIIEKSNDSEIKDLVNEFINNNSEDIRQKIIKKLNIDCNNCSKDDLIKNFNKCVCKSCINDLSYLNIVKTLIQISTSDKSDDEKGDYAFELLKDECKTCDIKNAEKYLNDRFDLN